MTDRLLNWMKTHDVPITREAYIQLAWGDEPPDPWMPEHEAELPEELQNTDVDDAQLELWDYNPSQPRAPAGSTEGGQWTKGGGGASSPPVEGMGARAKKGGETAKANAYFYKGGQFLPSTSLPPGAYKIGKRTLYTGREQIEPGKFEQQPTPLHRGIYSVIGGYTLVSPEGKLSLREGIWLHGGEALTSETSSTPGVKGILSTESTTYGEMIERYNKGERWVVVKPSAEVVMGSPNPTEGGDKLLLITHEPSHEQYDKWEIQIQERQNEIEKAGEIGSDEDDSLHRMKNALHEYARSTLEQRDTDKIGLSVVYGGPHDADETKLLAVTLVRFNPQEKVARVTLSGGTDRDAHIKSLQQVVARYGGQATRIEGASFGSDIESVLRYEKAGFKMAGETSTGLVRLIHGNPELTETEKKAKAEKEAQLEVARRNETATRARVTAAQLDFDPNLVRISDEEKTFSLGGKDRYYAGSYTRGDNAVVIYSKHATLGFVPSATAHEIGHRKFDALRARIRDERDDIMKEPGPPPDPQGKYWWQQRGGKDAVMSPDGTLKAPYDKKYPYYQAWQKIAELNYEKMREEDGVSDYSKEYWKGYMHGDVPIDSAFHETIAEMSRLKFESGKPQGSKNWNALFKLMEDHWAGMTKTERELKQPSSEKAYW